MRKHRPQSKKTIEDLFRHAKMRAIERYSVYLSVDQYMVLSEKVKSGNATFLLKESTARTHWLVDDQYIVVYDKRQHAISTFYPLKLFLTTCRRRREKRHEWRAMPYVVKFSKEFLTDTLDLPNKAIEDKIVDTGRWHTHHEIVFEYEGKFFETGYSRGATEQQDEGPWEHDDEVECTEVHQVEKLVKIWEPK